MEIKNNIEAIENRIRELIGVIRRVDIEYKDAFSAFCELRVMERDLTKAINSNDATDKSGIYVKYEEMKEAINHVLKNGVCSMKEATDDLSILCDGCIINLDRAKHIADEDSTCISKKYGALLVGSPRYEFGKDHKSYKDGNVVVCGIGANGAPKSRKPCTELDECQHVVKKIPRGTRYEECRSIHAEQRAIINFIHNYYKTAIFHTIPPIDNYDCIMYLYGYDANTKEVIPNYSPCTLCKRMILDKENNNLNILFICVARKALTGSIYPIFIDPKSWIINDDTLTDNVGY